MPWSSSKVTSVLCLVLGTVAAEQKLVSRCFRHGQRHEVWDFLSDTPSFLTSSTLPLGPAESNKEPGMVPSHGGDMSRNSAGLARGPWGFWVHIL